MDRMEVEDGITLCSSIKIPCLFDSMHSGGFQAYGQ